MYKDININNIKRNNHKKSIKIRKKRNKKKTCKKSNKKIGGSPEPFYSSVDMGITDKKSKVKQNWELLKSEKNRIGRQKKQKFSNIIDDYFAIIQERLRSLNTKNFIIRKTHSSSYSGNLKILDIRPLNKDKILFFWGKNCHKVEDISSHINTLSVLGKYRLKSPKIDVNNTVNYEELINQDLYYVSLRMTNNVNPEYYILQNSETIHKDRRGKSIPNGYKRDDIVYSIRDYSTRWNFLGKEIQSTDIRIGDKAKIVGTCDTKFCDKEKEILVNFFKRDSDGKKAGKVNVDVNSISKISPLILNPFHRYKIIQGGNVCSHNTDRLIYLQDVENEEKKGCFPVEFVQNNFVQKIEDLPIYAIFQYINLYHSVVNYFLQNLDKYSNISGFCRYSNNIKILIYTEEDNFDFPEIEEYKRNIKVIHKQEGDIMNLLQIKKKKLISEENISEKEWIKHDIEYLSKTLEKIKIELKEIYDKYQQQILDLSEEIDNKIKTKFIIDNSIDKLVIKKKKYFSRLSKKYSSGEYIKQDVIIINNFLQNCQDNSNKLIIDLTIEKKSSSHANFLIFNKQLKEDGSVVKNEQGEIVWDIYRYDPNGIYYLPIDTYFKEIYFKPYLNLNYKGLMWDSILELQEKHSLPTLNFGSNPSGTCSLLSCHVLLFSIMNPFMSIDNVILYILKKFSIGSIGDYKEKYTLKKCYIRLTEDLMARYFIELLYDTKGTFLDVPDNIKNLIPFFLDIFKEIYESPLVSRIDRDQDNNITSSNIDEIQNIDDDILEKWKLKKEKRLKALKENYDKFGNFL